VRAYGETLIGKGWLTTPARKCEVSPSSRNSTTPKKIRQIKKSCLPVDAWPRRKQDVCVEEEEITELDSATKEIGKARGARGGGGGGGERLPSRETGAGTFGRDGACGEKQRESGHRLLGETETAVQRQAAFWGEAGRRLRGCRHDSL